MFHKCIQVKVLFFHKYQIHLFIIGPPSPGSTYPSSSSQVARNATSGSSVGYSSAQNQSAFSAYLNYMSPSSAAAAAAASYANQMPRVRGPSQMPSM
jgi:hypothetical protein